MDVPKVTLSSGSRMPQLGLGVFLVQDDEARDVVRRALELGYRSIDTASAYQNEEGVGKALADSPVPRDQIFLTTKLWNDDQGYDATLDAFEESLRRLRVDYVDLYLIHWPVPTNDRYIDSWHAMEQLYKEGRARDIGVSNFLPEHLDRLIDECDVVPVVNQVELHPYFQQADLRQTHQTLAIVTEAWSPLAPGSGLLMDPLVLSIAAKHGRTAAQVVLRWHLDLGNVVIPKTVSSERLTENLDVFNFSLDKSDHLALSVLDRRVRRGPDPRTFVKP